MIGHRRTVDGDAGPLPDARTASRRLGVRRRIAPFAAVALTVTAVDQCTKALIRARLAEGEAWPDGGELLRLSHVENSGAAFGILQGAGSFLLVTTLIGVVAVAAYLIVAPPQRRLYTVALAMVLGGAAGNLIDRATRGTVTDFIDPTHYPAFNLADSAIVVGAIVLGWLTLRDGTAREDDATGDGAASDVVTEDGAREPGAGT